MFPSMLCHMYFLLYRWDQKKPSLEQPIIMRTFYVSTTIPEEKENDIFSDIDSEVEYDLQLKQNTEHGSTDNATMEVVAVARNTTSIYGDVESSVAVYVNSSIA